MQPITATISDAKRISGLGTTKLYQLIGEGKIDTIKIGRRRLVKIDSLRQLLGGAE